MVVGAFLFYRLHYYQVCFQDYVVPWWGLHIQGPSLSTASRINSDLQVFTKIMVVRALTFYQIQDY